MAGAAGEAGGFAAVGQPFSPFSQDFLAEAFAWGDVATWPGRERRKRPNLRWRLGHVEPVHPTGRGDLWDAPPVPGPSVLRPPLLVVCPDGVAVFGICRHGPAGSAGSVGSASSLTLGAAPICEVVASVTRKLSHPRSSEVGLQNEAWPAPDFQSVLVMAPDVEISAPPSGRSAPAARLSCLDNAR